MKTQLAKACGLREGYSWWRAGRERGKESREEAGDERDEEEWRDWASADGCN